MPSTAVVLVTVSVGSWWPMALISSILDLQRRYALLAIRDRETRPLQSYAAYMAMVLAVVATRPRTFGIGRPLNVPVEIVVAGEIPDRHDSFQKRIGQRNRRERMDVCQDHRERCVLDANNCDLVLDQLETNQSRSMLWKAVLDLAVIDNLSRDPGVAAVSVPALIDAPFRYLSYLES
jgi:hypothetical protein